MWSRVRGGITAGTLFTQNFQRVGTHYFEQLVQVSCGAHSLLHHRFLECVELTREILKFRKPNRVLRGDELSFFARMEVGHALSRGKNPDGFLLVRADRLIHGALANRIRRDLRAEVFDGGTNMGVMQFRQRRRNLSYFSAERLCHLDETEFVQLSFSAHAKKRVPAFVPDEYKRLKGLGVISATAASA
jgi:hypothetical protein